MDPLTALSIAGVVVQFVDFSAKIISETREIYKDGRLDVRYQTKKAVQDLSSFSTEMSTSIQSDGTGRTLTPNEVELGRLCSECSTLANTMVERLQTFEASGGFEKTERKLYLDGIRPIYKEETKIWFSIGTVLKSMWSAKDLEETEKNLKRYRDAINTRMLGSLRYVICESILHWK